MRPTEVNSLRARLGPGWSVVGGRRLVRNFAFADFRSALAFTNWVGRLAEKAGHHPDIFLAWGKVRLTLWTHSVGGLTRKDFEFASRLDVSLLGPSATEKP